MPWPFVLPFTASLLLVGLIAGLLSGRASRLGGGGAPLVSKAPAPVVSRRERPIDRFAPKGRLRQIDWRPPGEEAMLDAEPVKEEDRRRVHVEHFARQVSACGESSGLSRIC